MVLHLRTRQLLKECRSILGRNLRGLPPVFVSQVLFFIKTTLTNLIPYKAEIILKSSHSSPRISEHKLTVEANNPSFWRLGRHLRQQGLSDVSEIDGRGADQQKPSIKKVKPDLNQL